MLLIDGECTTQETVHTRIWYSYSALLLSVTLFVKNKMRADLKLELNYLFSDWITSTL